MRLFNASMRIEAIAAGYAQRIISGASRQKKGEWKEGKGIGLFASCSRSPVASHAQAKCSASSTRAVILQPRFVRWIRNSRAHASSKNQDVRGSDQAPSGLRKFIKARCHIPTDDAGTKLV